MTSLEVQQTGSFDLKNIIKSNNLDNKTKLEKAYIKLVNYNTTYLIKWINRNKKRIIKDIIKNNQTNYSGEGYSKTYRLWCFQRMYFADANKLYKKCGKPGEYYNLEYNYCYNHHCYNHNIISEHLKNITGCIGTITFTRIWGEDKLTIDIDV